MLALKITDLRKFMSAFLAGTAFDRLYLLEGSVTTFCTFTVDGHYQRAFYGEDADESTAEAGPAAGNASAAGVTADVSTSAAVGGTDRVWTPWALLRPHIFALIRGKHTPLAFRFIFQYPPESISKLFARNEYTESTAASVRALSLNLRFDGKMLILTTGTSLATFTMDRSADQLWDAWVKAFLNRLDIAYEPYT